jgi:ubiquinone/menaquinone biosynthesis C-methylase UbiE
MGGYAILGGQIGYDRLMLLARERQADTAALLARVGVGPGLRCLDLGCGGGAVTLELGRLTGPTGTAVGIDMDDVKLGLARQSAAHRQLSHVEFRALDVTQWSEPAGYDVVYGRFLLQHVADPVDLLGRMWAAVRPGGAVIVEDADFDGCYSEPSNAGFQLFLDLYPRLLLRRGGDASIGRKLHRNFRLAGIPAPQLALVNSVHSSGELKALRLLTLQATADAMLTEGLATEQELLDAVESLTAFTEDPDTIIGGPQIFQAYSRRTT